ncbi:MAG: 50S ribosomal protein L5, partial [Planctomycetota bacterium]
DPMAKNKSNKPDKDDPATQAAAAPREGMQRLRKRYLEEARSEVTKQFEVTNPMAMPVLDRVVLNVNMGRFLDGPKIPPNVRATVIDTLTQVTGQKPVVVKAKKSVSNFKVREGMETAAMVTLRGDRMWDFLDRFINLATPRIKDFRGLSDTSFDRAGNYSIGLTEQGVFPEINMANVTFTHGMNINFVFRNSDKAKSRTVLEALGMPFRKPPAPKKKAS